MRSQNNNCKKGEGVGERYLLLGTARCLKIKQVQFFEKNLLELAFLIVCTQRKQLINRRVTQSIFSHFQGLNGVDKIMVQSDLF